MPQIAEHISLDGALRFIIWKDDTDISLGFADYPWHTHADLLIGTYGDSEQNAVNSFLQNLFNDQLVIAISRLRDRIQDIWITDDPTLELKYIQPEEEIEFRYWSGKQWQNS